MAKPALELVEFEPQFAKVMVYLFGSAFVCDDSETAKKLVRFTSARGKAYTCVTVDGDKYEPQGTMHGGAVKDN